MIISDCAPPINTPAIVSDRKTPPFEATVEFTGIVPVDKIVAVEFTDGRFNWSFRCHPSELQSFAKFQQAAVRERGVWIHHPSQDEPRAARRKDEWTEAVRVAFQRMEAKR